MMDLSAIELKIKQIKPLLKQAAEVILAEDVSRYPIFILSETEINVGIPLVQPEQVEFYVNASTLEEFYVKKMIESEKVEVFRQNYKSPETHLCIFVVMEQDAKFIFIAN